MYSSYDGSCEAKPTNARKILILGGGQTVLVKVLNLTIAAVMPPLRFPMPATKLSC